MSFKLRIKEISLMDVQRRWGDDTVPEGFHHQMLDVPKVKPSLFGDCLEIDSPTIRVPPEYRLDEGHQTDLLTQERVVLL